MRDTIIHGDALAVLKTLADNSIDALCTDPPSGIHFMSASWDHDKGGRQQWIAWLQEIMAEALRCCKPGAHALVWALPRTSHWTATALEDAGWQIRDVITSITGQGFPKSLAIDKAIDKQLGAERRMVGYGDVRRASHSQPYGQGAVQDEEIDQRIITAPATPEAQQWAGFGSSLKPASEHWILCRKPLAAANLASNVLQYGCGALNIDQCRVEVAEDEPNIRNNPGVGTRPRTVFDSLPLTRGPTLQGKRWPPNFLLSHSPLCQRIGTKQVRGSAPPGKPSRGKTVEDASMFGLPHNNEYLSYTDADGMETVEFWECAPECPVRLLDEQAGERKSGGRSHQAGDLKFYKNTYRDGTGTNLSDYHLDASEGGPSRFFPVFTPDMPVAYFPKASRRDRSSDGAVNNTHPTCKNTTLMSWLVRLITPPGGTVLDCFAGSGSTLVACVQEGFHYIGIEQQADYVEICKARLAHASRNAPLARPEAQQVALPAKIIKLPRRKKHTVSELQLSLFA